MCPPVPNSRHICDYRMRVRLLERVHRLPHPVPARSTGARGHCTPVPRDRNQEGRAPALGENLWTAGGALDARPPNRVAAKIRRGLGQRPWRCPCAAPTAAPASPCNCGCRPTLYPHSDQLARRLDLRGRVHTSSSTATRAVHDLYCVGATLNSLSHTKNLLFQIAAVSSSTRASPDPDLSNTSIANRMLAARFGNLL